MQTNVDVSAGNEVAAGAQWIEAILLGQVATALAVICIAIVGLMMLNGRINWRRGAIVVTGCFVLFGAPSIARGLLFAFGPQEANSFVAPVTVPPAPPPVVARHPDSAYDPYAGASIIRQAPPPVGGLPQR